MCVRVCVAAAAGLPRPRGAVDVNSLPHIVYLSRGHLFEYRGSREQHDLTQFAYDKLNRHTQQQQQHEDVDDDSRPVPAPQSSSAALADMTLRWAGQLHHTVTTLPAVAAALVAVGIMLGALLALLALAVLLPNEATAAAARKAPASSAALVTQPTGPTKARKAD